MQSPTLIERKKPASLLSQSAKELLDIATRTKRPKQVEILQLVLKLLDPAKDAKRGVVVIWLRDWKKKRYLLDRLWPATSFGPSEALTNIFVKEPDDADSTKLEAIGRDLVNQHSEVRRLASEAGCADVECVSLFDAGEVNGGKSAFETGQNRIIGFIQVWVDSPLQDEQRELLEWAAKTLGNIIYRGRRKRELDAMRHMLDAFRTGNTKKGWFETAAKTLQEITDSQACIVFEPAPQGQLNAVASWPLISELDKCKAGAASVLRRICESPRSCRVADFQDRNERLQEFGTAEYDQELEKAIDGFASRQKAWMAVPVVVDDQVLAIIVLLNKMKGLPCEFSATDQTILERICRYLEGVIPSVIVTEVLDNLSKLPLISITSLLPSPEDKQSRDIDPSKIVFETLSSIVPTVNGAVLGIQRDGEPNQIVHLGGSSFLKDNESLLEQTWNSAENSKTILRQVDGDNASVTNFAVSEIQGLQFKRACLAVTVNSPRLSRHEEKMLKMFCNHLGQHLHAEEQAEAALRDVVEIRHNIRAGLHGLGHLEVALTIAEIARNREYRVPTQLLQKAFKSVRRGHLYAEQSRMLLEHSRFMLNEIGSDALRLQRSAVREIIREVILALDIQAEDYRIIIDLVDQIPSNLDEMDVDRGLVYILFFNLVENAVKYSQEKQHVQVRLGVSQGKWHFSVTNIGPYINPADRIAIFRPFVRRFAPKYRKARPGTGLGLPVVRQIVRAHGGEYAVESQRFSAAERSPARNVFSITMPRKIA